MPSQGVGPSRRSHTKSRKGCKTCKRRHIRCDETFPQCRNCTKHQVRCDYMESLPSDTESQSSLENPTLALTPDSEDSVDHWQQTGIFPFPGLQVFPPPQPKDYSRNELRLIYHLCSISNDHQARGLSSCSVWTQKISKFLSIATSYSYVMHALLSFSANHLAWMHDSAEIRNLHIHHGGVALRGLHEAIGNFSHANADAVLAASLLMLWQATDWRSWSSLRGGIQSVLSAMSNWQDVSLFAEFVAGEDFVVSSFRTHRRRPSIDPTERSFIVQNAIQALHQLGLGLAGHELERQWSIQLSNYVQRLQSLDPAQSPEEQFAQAYYLRKWLFWTPIQLLTDQGDKKPAMLTMAHLYAVALSLEPLFPDLGSSFCAALAFPALEATFLLLDNVSAIDSSMAALLHYPRQTAFSYRSRAAQTQGYTVQSDILMLSPSFEFGHTSSIGNLSPAFAPSQLHHDTPRSSSSQSSSYLEVPTTHGGFTYGTQSWGAMPSPGFPAQDVGLQDEHCYQYSLDVDVFSGGFVPPTLLWT